MRCNARISYLLCLNFVQHTIFNVVGGETVKEINRMSGASVELSRERPPNPVDRIFHIKGSQEQIQYAIQLICEKAGIVSAVFFREEGSCCFALIRAEQAISHESVECRTSATEIHSKSCQGGLLARVALVACTLRRADE